MRVIGEASVGACGNDEVRVEMVRRMRVRVIGEASACACGNGEAVYVFVASFVIFFFLDKGRKKKSKTKKPVFTFSVIIKKFN